MRKTWFKYSNIDYSGVKKLLGERNNLLVYQMSWFFLKASIFTPVSCYRGALGSER